MVAGNVGDRMFGSPKGLLKGWCTGDSNGGRPCGVAFEGPDLSMLIFVSFDSDFCDDERGRRKCDSECWLSWLDAVGFCSSRVSVGSLMHVSNKTVYQLLQSHRFCDLGSSGLRAEAACFSGSFTPLTCAGGGFVGARLGEAFLELGVGVMVPFACFALNAERDIFFLVVEVEVDVCGGCDL